MNGGAKEGASTFINTEQSKFRKEVYENKWLDGLGKEYQDGLMS